MLPIGHFKIGTTEKRVINIFIYSYMRIVLFAFIMVCISASPDIDGDYVENAFISFGDNTEASRMFKNIKSRILRYQTDTANELIRDHNRHFVDEIVTTTAMKWIKAFSPSNDNTLE